MNDNTASGTSSFIRLSIMMFIQFFIWGAWYVTAPNYLGTIGFAGKDFGWTYSVGPIAGMISPFFVGMIADRFFATERVLGVMHILGGIIMYFAAQTMAGGEASPNFINALFFGFMLCYFPTLALTNTLAMKNIVNTEKQFPLVRVFGTIGWIAAGLSLSWIGWDASVNMFKLTAGAAVLLGVYSFTLPHTPPVKTEGGVTARELLGLDAFSLFKRPAFLIFMVASFLVCIPLSFYYILASRVVELVNLPLGQTMSYGQMSEIVFMILMPFFFRKLGVKWMLTVGILTWVIRYVLFAVGAPSETMWMILIGIVVHGICYDFFFVTGQIYTDKVAPEAIRGQAQGMLVLFTLGLGMFIGAQVAGRIETNFTPQASIDHGAQVAELGTQLGAEEISPEKTAELDAQKAEARHAQLATMNWKMIWGIPAAIAGAVLLLFVLVFKDDEDEAPAETANAPPAEL